MLALVNARIHAGEERAGALLIDDEGKVRASAADGSTWSGVPVKDFRGRAILPGFIDAHLHLSHLAVRARGLTFSGRESLEEVAGAVRRRAREQAVSTWILGHGYDDTAWQPGRAGRSLLDRAAPSHPVFLERKDGHSGWANSLALQRSEIAESVADPPGGRFERDAGGRLTGILKESARLPVLEAIPQPSASELRTLLLETMQRLRRLGLTTVCSIGDRAEFTALQELRTGGVLPLRVCQYLPASSLEEVLSDGWHSGLGDDWLWFGGVKFFADGSLGSRTAWLDQPYEGSTDCGICTTDPGVLREQVKAANAAGVATAIHAIGDRALSVTLDAIEAAQASRTRVHELAFRNRIEHVQLGRPEHFARMAALQVIASMQPLHALADRILAEREWGPRCRHAYAWRSALEAGVTLAFGSDAPVETPDPLPGLRAAVSRQDPAGGPPWYPEQSLQAGEALRAYGPGAARAVGRSDRLGQLRPGMLADFVVLQGDPTDRGASVESTYIGGQLAREGPA